MSNTTRYNELVQASTIINEDKSMSFRWISKTNPGKVLRTLGGRGGKRYSTKVSRKRVRALSQDIGTSQSRQ